MSNAFSTFQNTGDYKRYKLLLGAGEKKVKGWVSVDIDKSTNPMIVADLNKDLPFQSGGVDAIRMDYVIEHLKDLNHFFKEANRVLKRGGIVEIQTCNFSFWRVRLAYLFGNFKETSAFSVWHCWLFKPSQLKLIAESHDFDTKIEGIGLLPFLTCFTIILN